MKRLAMDIAVGVIVWFATNVIERITGGTVIQGFLASLWHRFPFEIVTLFIMIFVLACVEYWRIFILGMKEYERVESEKDRVQKDFKIKIEKDIADLNEKYIQILQAARK